MRYLGASLSFASLRNDVKIALNWDLTYYLVFSLLDDFTMFIKKNTIHFEMDWPPARDEREERDSTLTLRMDGGFFKWRASAMKRRRDVRRLMGVLNARLSKDASELTIPAKVRVEPVLHIKMAKKSAELKEQPPSPTFRTIIKEETTKIPPNLKFGVLDDVALVRLATLSFLAREFSANVIESFTSGGARGDITGEGFTQAVEKNAPDVLIIDYYLDVVEGDGGTMRTVLGTDVAKRCREEIRFEGVILIHTANEGVRERLDYEVVDGFLSKSFNRATYERVLSEALVKRARNR